MGVFKMELLKHKIAVRLRYLRIINNLQQKDVAKILGIKQNTYSDIETKKILITLDKLLILCDFYKVDINFFLED